MLAVGCAMMTTIIHHGASLERERFDIDAIIPSSAKRHPTAPTTSERPVPSGTESSTLPKLASDPPQPQDDSVPGEAEGRPVAVPEASPTGESNGADDVEYVTPSSTLPENSNGGGGRTRCSEVICDIKCRINSCPLSECLDNGRCRCYCPRSVDPVQAFFSSILTSHMEPGLRVHFGPSLFRPRPQVYSPPSFFGMPQIPEMEDDDTSREVAKAAETPFVMHTKIYSTVSQTCVYSDDCAEACHNCNVTNCVYGFCQCTSCQRSSQTDLDSRRTSNVLKTCQSARQCGEHCSGCSSVMCRYGVCECNMCKKTEEKKPAPPSVEVSAQTEDPITLTSTTATEQATTDEEAKDSGETVDGATSTTTTMESSMTTTTTAAAAEEPAESVTEVVRIVNNATDITERMAGANGSQERQLGGDTEHKKECVPKRCNHSCWERQCRKFRCEHNRCVCDQCPKEVVAVVSDRSRESAVAGQEGSADDAEQMEKNRYEVVF